MNHITLYRIQYRCLFPLWPKVYLLVSVTVHTSYQRINPKWDSAEVALDFDWILSIESSYPNQFSWVCHRSDKHERQWRCRVLPSWYRIRIEWRISISIEWLLEQVSKSFSDACRMSEDTQSRVERLLHFSRVLILALFLLYVFLFLYTCMV